MALLIQVIACRSLTLPPATATNAVFLGQKEFFVVDPATPYADEQQRFDCLVEDRLACNHHFRAILLTHHHDDHVGDAARLSAKFEVPIWAHPVTRSLVNFTVHKDLLDGDWLPDHQGQDSFKAIFTPGHAPGHLCFFDPQSRIIIAGDMVASEGTILIEPDLGNLGHYLASLKKLLDLNPSSVIPAHGETIHKGAQKIAHTLAHRHLRLEQLRIILSTHSDQAQSAADLVAAVYGPRINDLTRKLAALSLTSSLKFLAERNQAHCRSDLTWYVEKLDSSIL